MYTFQPNLRSITRIFSADYAENRRIRKRYNEHFMEINVLAHSGDVSSPGGNASQPRGTTNRSQTTNQPCSLRCLSLGGIHVSTGQWKHVRWPVETFPQASGRQRNVHILTTEAHKIDSKASVFPTSLARSKEKLTRRFFIFLQYFCIF